MNLSNRSDNGKKDVLDVHERLRMRRTPEKLQTVSEEERKEQSRNGGRD